jgi:hypothetical protein
MTKGRDVWTDYSLQGCMSHQFWDTAHQLGKATAWLTNRNLRVSGKIMQANCMGTTDKERSTRPPTIHYPRMPACPASQHLASSQDQGTCDEKKKTKKDEKGWLGTWRRA